MGLFLQPAYFDTVKKILELTYAQAVIWFGIFFAPMLSVVGILRVIILYYVQKFSTEHFCTPKGTPFVSSVSLPGLIWMTMGVHLVVGAIPCWYLVITNSPSGIYSPTNYHFVDNLFDPSWEFDTFAASDGAPEVADLEERLLRRRRGSHGSAEDVSEAFAVDVLGEAAAAALGSLPGDNITGWCIVDTVSIREQNLWTTTGYRCSGDAEYLDAVSDTLADATLPIRVLDSDCVAISKPEVDELKTPRCVREFWTKQAETVATKGVSGPFQGPAVNCSDAGPDLEGCEREGNGVDLKCCTGVLEKGRTSFGDDPTVICEPNCRVAGNEVNALGETIYVTAQPEGTLVPQTLYVDNQAGNARACAELPNRVSGGLDDVGCVDNTTRKDCSDCVINRMTGLKPTEAELDSAICYDQPAEDRWLPHDCGVELTLRQMCSKCPSGCGPFRNTESFFDVLTAGSETWATEASDGVSKPTAAINSFLKSFFEFVGSAPFTVILLLIMIAMYAILRAKISAGKAINARLLQQREMDRMDKQWMIEEYGITLQHRDSSDNMHQKKDHAKAEARKAKKH